jgi:hypothetical protein
MKPPGPEILNVVPIPEDAGNSALSSSENSAALVPKMVATGRPEWLRALSLATPRPSCDEIVPVQ